MGALLFFRNGKRVVCDGKNLYALYEAANKSMALLDNQKLGSKSWGQVFHCKKSLLITKTLGSGLSLLLQEGQGQKSWGQVFHCANIFTYH